MGSQYKTELSNAIRTRDMKTRTGGEFSDKKKRELNEELEGRLPLSMKPVAVMGVSKIDVRDGSESSDSIVVIEFEQKNGEHYNVVWNTDVVEALLEFFKDHKEEIFE